MGRSSEGDRQSGVVRWWLRGVSKMMISGGGVGERGGWFGAGVEDEGGEGVGGE